MLRTKEVGKELYTLLQEVNAQKRGGNKRVGYSPAGGNCLE